MKQLISPKLNSLLYFAWLVVCLVDRFRGYGVLAPPKLPFPIDLLRRPYNSIALPCDTVIHDGLRSLMPRSRSGAATVAACLQTTLRWCDTRVDFKSNRSTTTAMILIAACRQSLAGERLLQNESGVLPMQALCRLHQSRPTAMKLAYCKELWPTLNDG